MGTRDALEDRLRAVEDTLAIYHLIASHPPAADTGTDRYYRDAFTSDGEIDLGGGKGATENGAIAGIVKTPEHQAAIAAGRIAARRSQWRYRGGDVLSADHHARPAWCAARVVWPRHIDRFSDPPRWRQSLGTQARKGRVESDAPNVASARRRQRCKGLAATGLCAISLTDNQKGSALCPRRTGW